MLFYQYLHNNNVRPVLETIDKPAKALETLKDPLTAALEHEEYVTGLINQIYAAAQEVKDFRTTQFLDWFVKEQGEEEKNADDLIFANNLSMIGSSLLISKLAGIVG